MMMGNALLDVALKVFRRGIQIAEERPYVLRLCRIVGRHQAEVECAMQHSTMNASSISIRHRRRHCIALTFPVR
jgi:hypothetical protein